MDQRGHGDAAGCGKDRQQRVAEVRQLAVVELALELEPDEQEENRHQCVVDPVLDAQPAERLLPQAQVARRRAPSWRAPARRPCRRSAATPPDFSDSKNSTNERDRATGWDSIAILGAGSPDLSLRRRPRRGAARGRCAAAAGRRSRTWPMRSRCRPRRAPPRMSRLMASFSVADAVVLDDEAHGQFEPVVGQPIVDLRRHLGAAS